MKEKTLRRYLKVREHVERGVPGERDAAKEVLKGLESQYPGVREAAEKLEREDRAAQRQPTAPSGSSTPDASKYWGSPVGTGTARTGTGNWENIFRYAQGFYETVKDVVEEASDAFYGRTLAEETVEVTAGSRDRHVFVRMKVPFEAVAEARELNAVQKEMFRQTVHEMLDEYVDAILHD